jgi:anaerobic selenocysteine-containing dehydrogenase
VTGTRVVGNDAPMADDEVTETTSFCRICNAMCGIVVSVAGDRIVGVRGDADHPLSRGYTCPKGRALPQFHHHPDRLDHPTVRGSTVDWATALDDIAASIRSLVDGAGPDSVAMYLASGSAFDTNGRRAAERFLRVLGSRQKYTATTIDTPSKPLVAELVGGWSGLTPIWDHQRSTLLVLFGSNPVVSHGHSNSMPDPVRRLRDHRRTREDGRTGELWVVDPRRTETAALADHHLQIRGGTDHVLLAHLVRELLHDGADHAYLAAHADGVAQLREAVAPFDLATTASRTGLAPEQIDGLVAAVRRHGHVSALTGTGVSMAATANVTEWMLWALHVVTASYDRPGGMWFNPGYLMQLDTRTWTPSDGTPEPGPASRPELPRRFDEYPCAGLVDEIESGNVRALLVVGGNPVTALPDEPRTRRALASLDVLVVIDVIDTATSALATHVLPAAGQLERSDLPWLLDAYQLEVATQYTPAVVAPGAQRQPVWRTFAALGARLGLDVLPRGMSLESATDDDLLRSVAQRSRGGADEVFAARSGTVAGGGTPFGWVTEGVLPQGRWRLAPPPLLAQLAALEAAGPSPADGPEVADAAAAALTFIPQRRLRMMNSQLRDVAARGGRVEAAYLSMHPDDAARRGVEDGAAVTVTSTHTGGVLHADARLDDRIARGTVSLPHGWDDVNVSMLTSASIGVDPLTGMVLQSGLAVEVRPRPPH